MPTQKISEYTKNPNRFQVNQTGSNRKTYNAPPIEKMSQGHNPNFTAAATTKATFDYLDRSFLLASAGSIPQTQSHDFLQQTFVIDAAMFS